ncbi:MAG: RNA polymerase sigma factor [Rhodanobacter sp.]|jgi:RNA polymerase sigma factor (sigma-70 family)|uniref:RNA polymerase sigma factor n=1 Tax=Rhodanobacter sp. KK11 TaxID=3083255 RepID=UPI0029664A53|nr:RNA polymerase sigma factor [Rhodanobacter sp. KK11]MDW2980770.1 RNA polymerase sigma factor [Rhodanobacter sp. KK11]
MRWWRPRVQAPVQTEEGAGQQRAARLTSQELTRIFLEIQPSLERVIRRRVGDAQAAQDLAQDLYLRFQRIAEQLPNEDEARRYLMRMATNAAIDHLRSENYRMQLLVGVLTLFDRHEKDIVDPTADPARSAEMQEQYQLIDAGLSALPSICGDILYLSRVEGLTHAEIGEKLGLSKSSIEKYMMRALRECRRRVEGA